jgi:hypothetical protein
LQVSVLPRIDAGLPWYRFDTSSGVPERVVRGAEQDAREGAGRGLFCRLCRHGITRQEAGIAVNGRQVHVRTNPAGITFEFGCYSGAPGCAAVGSPTAEHTWFPGHSWQIAVCGGCGEHLGWRFRGEGGFFGLILSRLVSDPG